jgi:ribonuclease HIII
MPLELDEERTRLSVVSSIKFDNRPSIPVLFIVDTGSPVTFVDEFVSSKVRIYTKNLVFDHDALLGGTKVGMYNCGKVALNFKNGNGAVTSISLNNMKVSKSQWSRKEAIYSSTSIIGLDFFL